MNAQSERQAEWHRSGNEGGNALWTYGSSPGGYACPDRHLTTGQSMDHSGDRDSRGTEPVDDFTQALSAKRAAKIDDFI